MIPFTCQFWGSPRQDRKIIPYEFRKVGDTIHLTPEQARQFREAQAAITTGNLEALEALLAKGSDERVRKAVNRIKSAKGGLVGL